jgi:hypothetical protein
MSQNSRNQGFSYVICLKIEGSGSRAGSGSGSIPLTNGSGSGRPKNTWIRIRNTGTHLIVFWYRASWTRRRCWTTRTGTRGSNRTSAAGATSPTRTLPTSALISALYTSTSIGSTTRRRFAFRSGTRGACALRGTYILRNAAYALFFKHVSFTFCSTISGNLRFAINLHKGSIFALFYDSGSRHLRFAINLHERSNFCAFPSVFRHVAFALCSTFLENAAVALCNKSS